MNECTCLSEGPRRPDVIDERYIGRDDTGGRFADVSLLRCSRCRRLWLRYAVEYEAYSRSGRWAAAPIDQTAAVTMTPEVAAPFLDRAELCIVGGVLLRPPRAQGSRPVSLGDLNQSGLRQRPGYAACLRRTHHHVLFSHQRHALDQRRKSCEPRRQGNVRYPHGRQRPTQRNGRATGVVIRFAQARNTNTLGERRSDYRCGTT